MYLRGMHKASAEILCFKSAVGMKSWKLYSQANILVSKGMLLKTSDIEIYLSLSHGTQKLGLSFWCLFVLCLMKFCRFAPRIEQFERIVMHNPSTSLYTRKGKFYTHKSTLQYLQKWELYTIIKPFPYEGKSLNNMNFIVLFFYKSTYRNCLCPIFGHSPPASQHTWSTCPQACGCPPEKIFLAWPLTNFAPPPLPRWYLQTSDPTNVLS